MALRMTETEFKGALEDDQLYHSADFDWLAVPGQGIDGTYGKGYGQIIEHPVFAFLVEGGGRKILVDTGMSDTE